MIDFVKMHGTGNDFPVIGDLDDRLQISAEAVRRITDRNFGIGGDGLIRVTRGTEAEFFMDYRNADGSVPEMCGNGVRVTGKWLGDRGFADDVLDLQTVGGVRRLRLQRGSDGLVSHVTVDMGQPVGEVVEEALIVDGVSLAVTIVAHPNPHAVIFVNDVDHSPVHELGPQIECHERFPDKTNVEFVDFRDEILRQRTWERACGETLACGSGACAVMVAAQRKGMVGIRATIALRGGQLQFEREPGGPVMMTGPAVEVFRGSFPELLLG